jgi:hypothetical protein
MQEILSFTEEGRDPDPPTAESRRENLELQADLMRNALRDGATVLGGATYLLTLTEPGAEEFRARVRTITDSAEPMELKIARIQAYTGHREAAIDLLLARTR